MEKKIKITLQDVSNSRNFYRHKIKYYNKRIEELKKHHCPQLILDNEERLLKEAKKNFNIFSLITDFYKKGVKDGLNKDMTGMEYLNKNLTPEERLYKAIFNEGE